VHNFDQPIAATTSRAAERPAEPAPITTTSGFDGIDCDRAGIAAVASNPVKNDLRVMDPSAVFMFTQLFLLPD